MESFEKTDSTGGLDLERLARRDLFLLRLQASRARRTTGVTRPAGLPQAPRATRNTR